MRCSDRTAAAGATAYWRTRTRGLAEFSRHCEAEGWQLAASGDGAHVFEAVREVSGALDERGSRAYARGRCGRRALCWAALAAAVALAVLLLGLWGHLPLWRRGALAALCFLPALPPLALCLHWLRRGRDAARGVGARGVMRRWWQGNALLRAAAFFAMLIACILLAAL